MLRYMARIFINEDGIYQVDFPDFEGIITWSDTLEGAKKMAQEALSGHIGTFYVLERESLPKPSQVQGEDLYEIIADMSVLFSYELKKFRKDKGLSQEQVATFLGYKQPSYNKLESGKANPSLKRVQEISQVLGIDLFKELAFIS